MKKIVFFGTPEISSAGLAHFLKNPEIQVLAVVTNPDALVGRKQVSTPSPVKKLALQNNIPVFTPEKASDENTIDALKKLDADFFVVISYGKILPQKLITIPKFGTFNLHFSLLPKYRGASPVQQAILENEEYSGISLFKIVPELDAGEIYWQQTHEIKNKTAHQCLQEMIEKGSIAFEHLILSFENYTPRAQNNAEATFCRKIEKKDGLVNAKNESAKQIFQKFLAYNPWPGIYSITKEGKRIIWKNIEPANKTDEDQKIERNTLFQKNGNVFLQTLSGVLKINSIQIEGKKESPARVLELS